MSKIEKGKLLWHLIKSLRRGSDTSRSLPYGIRDKRIFSLLQENKSAYLKKSEGELRTLDARFLVEQDPDKHPIAYASIQMAKYMLYGKGEGFLRNVPSRLIEKLLPSERYSPFQ